MVAFAPEFLLTLLALVVTTTSDTTSSEVTLASAVFLTVVSLIFYGWYTLSAWLFSLRNSHDGLTAWGFRRPTTAILWTVPLALVAVYVVTAVHDVVVHPEQQDIVSEFPETGAGLLLFVLVAVVMAPVFEELFFRGFLFRGFAASWGWVWGALISAAIFSAAHLQFSVFLPLFALGFALAWVYKRTGSLWSSIALHAVFNGISVLVWALTW